MLLAVLACTVLVHLNVPTVSCSYAGVLLCHHVHVACGWLEINPMFVVSVIPGQATGAAALG
jgi:hypothetical protein